MGGRNSSESRARHNRTYYVKHREAINARRRAVYVSVQRRPRSRMSSEMLRVAVRLRQRQARIRLATDLRALKLLRGCVDCGYDENADALEFDHVRGTKLKTISGFTYGARLIAEIAKCEVRCANCHAIATRIRSAA